MADGLFHSVLWVLGCVIRGARFKVTLHSGSERAEGGDRDARDVRYCKIQERINHLKCLK